MSNDDEGKKEKFLKELEEELADRKKAFKSADRLHLCTTLAVTGLGILTSTGATDGYADLIIFGPEALVAYGVATAICGGVLLYLNNKGNSPTFKHTVKLAMEAIRDFLKYSDLNLDRAIHLKVNAKSRPDEVLSELQQSRNT